MKLWSHRFSKLPTQKFKDFCPWSLIKNLVVIILITHGKSSLDMQKNQDILKTLKDRNPS